MRKAFAFSLVIFMAARVLAGNGGSAYTAFGLGDLRYSPSVRSMGMGYTGIGLPSPAYINALIPASWTRINRVRIEANGIYEGINTAEEGRSLYQAKGLFNGAMLAIPISQQNGIVLSGGFSPYSIVGYNTAFTASQNGLDYNINEVGSGGLYRGVLGLSYAPAEDAAFGASLNYLFGNFTQERVFSPLTPGASGSTFFVEEANRGVNFTLSGMYSGFGKFSEALRPLSLGVVLTTEANMKFDLSNRVNFSSEQDTFGVTEKRMTIPVAFGVGAAYQVADRWLLAADFFTQAWSNARYDGLPFEFIRNSSRFGLGAEKLPIKDASAWLDKLAYRLGVSYHQTYFEIFGQPINEIAFTTGFTMPVAGETRLSVGIEYALRGEKKAVQGNNGNVNLLKDSIIRVALSLSIAELWFVRYEEE